MNAPANLVRTASMDTQNMVIRIARQWIAPTGRGI